MYPIVCKIGPFTIYSYGLLFALATLVCIFLLSKDAKRLGLSQDFAIDFTFWILIGGILGARVLYILLNLRFFSDNPGEIFKLWHGGLVWHGGLIGAIIFGIFYLKIKRLAVIETLDLISPYVALGQAIGRIGCFLNGCCYGKPSSFGLYFPMYNTKLFPAQLFSSLNLFLIFIFLKYIQKKSYHPGKILFSYLILASLERLIVEFLRGDSPAFIWNLTIFQVISLIIFMVSIYGKIFLQSRRRG